MALAIGDVEALGECFFEGRVAPGDVELVGDVEDVLEVGGVGGGGVAGV